MTSETPGAVAAAGGTAAAVSGPAGGSGAGGGLPGAGRGRATGAGRVAGGGDGTRNAGAAAVRTRGLSLRGTRGWVFRDVDLDVPAGGLAAVSGIAGSGRTALLLTLGGRMKPAGGTGTIGGVPLDDLRAVQRIAALGIVSGVTGLDPALTVREHVREALALHEGVLGRFRGRAARTRAALDRVGLDVDPRTLAEDLDPDEARLLGAALALVGKPRLLLLDDVDEGLPAARQRALWRRLRAIADSGVTVVAACHDPAPAMGIAQTVVHLP
ncbi:ATP-binding cassette domain-containing protein [Actinomadura opuntiae]|uniref:ATP-binding cassette domain-containing protein n=1 Tax=Actinomadura sp. OS1-43 TaxID=604315 RepID=UPI00255B3020|nr:ATP-binding cassette domain-containing protein [Actinomadura sp. OS1-43]MDL4814549.1 ATP-binding cassette domain-containing protein [Actinomadura sp. OS1-43]